MTLTAVPQHKLCAVYRRYRNRGKLPLRYQLKGTDAEVFGGLFFLFGALLVLGAILLAAQAANITSESVARLMSPVGDDWKGVAVLAVAAGACWGVALSAAKRKEASVKPIGPFVLVGGFVLVVAVTVGMLTWLLQIAGTAPPESQSSAQIDAIKTALATAAGTGGAFGLLLAFRRQRTNEISERGQSADLVERRITELYGRAIDQLGNERAAVRLAALYSLERLAQGNPSQRQVIVDVICAYLRIPPDKQQRPTNFRRPASAFLADEPLANDEREVRLTAQKILVKHVSLKDRDLYRGDVDEFWPDISIDLSGASLEEFALDSAEVKRLVLSRCSIKDGVSLTAVRILNECSMDSLSETIVRIQQCDFQGPVDLAKSRLRYLSIVESVASGAIFAYSASLTRVNLAQNVVASIFICSAEIHQVDIYDSSFLRFELAARVENLTISRSSVARQCSIESSHFLRGSIVRFSARGHVTLPGAGLGSVFTERFRVPAELSSMPAACSRGTRGSSGRNYLHNLKGETPEKPPF